MTAPHRVGKYDVFISHCGKDCKKDFANLLRDDLERAGLSCFLDEPSLEVGKVAEVEMRKAMEEATYGVVIISPGFFEREWCMKELETFARRNRMVAVFLGSFAAIQAAAEAAVAKGVWGDFEQFKWNEEEYKGLVREATKFVGVKLAEEGWWSSCIRRVRDEVLRLLGKVGGGIKLSEDELLLGQEEHLKELKRLLGLHQKGMPAPSEGRASREVGIVGVKGMGGVGKSTIAKKLYDEPDVREWFTGGICWLEVGQKPGYDRIRRLQGQVLKHLCNVDEDPGGPTQGRAKIRQLLGGKRVLICLDDVWELASVATPIVRIDDLGAGSRILTTSRRRDSIEEGGTIHDLDSLGLAPAWELFCWHAFRGEKPPNDLAVSAEKAALRCGGLPLALRVLGRQVAAAKDQGECIQTFLKLRRVNDAMVACRNIIERSVDNLLAERRDLRDILILIAGVWPRTPIFMDRQRVVEHLGAAVYGGKPRHERYTLATNALNKLNDLSLVGLERHGDEGGSILTVHDLIVDVAQTLADGEEQGCRRFFRQPAGQDKLRLPRDPSRLEHLSLRLGSVFIPRVSAAYSLVLGPDADLVGSFSKDDKPSLCRLLDMEGVQSGLLHDLSGLQCLRLRRGSFDVFPEGIENMSDMCILEIRECKALQSLPESVGALTGLTSLDLRGCRALASLPESVGQLTGLTRLDLRWCEALGSLPKSVGRLTGLTRLDLSGCRALASLPESVGALTGLRSLDLRGCGALRGLPGSVGRLTGLTRLDLSGCRALASLPGSVGQLTGLTSLSLSGCLESLPETVGALTGLRSLNLSECEALRSLPESVGALTGLKSLRLSWCKALASLPGSVGQLTGLTRLELRWCEALGRLPELVGQLTGLTSLDLRWCEALGSLPESVGQLTGLTSLDLSGCRALASLPESVGALTGLTRLDLSGCRALASLPGSVGQLTGLTSLGLSGCLESLPDTVGALTGLRSLDLSVCRALATLPEQVGALTGLTSLRLSGCKALASLPGSVGQLTGLTRLDLSGCEELRCLPGSVGQLTGLTRLDLSGCEKLRSLPESVGRLTGLTSLDLSRCESLAAAPDLTACPALRMLSLAYCSNIQEVSIPNWVATVNLTGCRSLAPPSDTLCDDPTNVDLLNVKGICGAVAGFLTDEGTKAPVTLAFHGLWGKGKSTAMKILEQEVKETMKTMVVVWFKAWLQRDHKEIWAGLAVEVGQAIEGRLTVGRRLQAYISYAFEKRTGEMVVNAVSLLFSSLAASLVVALGLPTSLVRAKASISASLVGTLVVLGVVGWLAFLVWRLNAILRPISEQIAGYVVSPTTEHLGYVGYQNRVIKDLEFLGRWAGANSDATRVLVFIDDLDRSPDDAVVSILEAVNVILGGCDHEHLSVFTVFGLDLKMTTRAIFNHFKSDASGAELSAEDSRRFLQKIIQLSLELPPSTESERKEYVAKLLGGTVEDDGRRDDSAAAGRNLLAGLPESLPSTQRQRPFFPADPALEEEAGADIGGQGGADVAASDWGRQLRENVIEKVKRGLAVNHPMRRSWFLGLQRRNGYSTLRQEDNDETSPGGSIRGATRTDSVAAELLGNDYIGFLPDNPRQVKSMINNYRLAYRVLLQRVVESGETYNRWRIHLVTWVVLVATFPDVAPLIKPMGRAGVPGVSAERPEKENILKDLLKAIRKAIRVAKERQRQLMGIEKQHWTADKEVALLQAKSKADGDLEAWRQLELNFSRFQEAAKKVSGRKSCGDISYKDLAQFRCFSAGLALNV